MFKGINVVSITVPDLDRAREFYRDVLEDMTGELGELHRFGRAAIANDKQWIKAATEFATTLFPQIEARVYSPDEKDEALAWVSGVEGKDTPAA